MSYPSSIHDIVFQRMPHLMQMTLWQRYSPSLLIQTTRIRTLTEYAILSTASVLVFHFICIPKCASFLPDDVLSEYFDVVKNPGEDQPTRMFVIKVFICFKIRGLIAT